MGVLRIHYGLVALLWAARLAAQTTGTTKDLADMSVEDLLNVRVISAARHEQRHLDSPRAISVLTAEDLLRGNYRTVPEALNELVGVMVQETNYAGGSPIIRGMIGNRILILVDGIRLNNAIYRLGPNQYLNTIDLHQVERIEVVRGAGSVLYGSDALGGLINVITKSPEGTGSGSNLQGRAFTRFSSLDRGWSTRLEAGGRRGRLGFFGGASGKRFGDLGRQRFTGYHEVDGDLKLSYQLSERSKITAGFERVHQDGADRTDLLAAGSDLRYEWRPQQRDLAYAEYRMEGWGRYIDGVQVALVYQNQLEKLNRIVTSRPSIERQQQHGVRALGVTTQFTSRLGERQGLTYGVEYSGDGVTSRRTDANLTTGARTEAKGTFADGATYRSFAAFVQDEIEVTGRLSLNLGLRFSRFDLKALTSDPGTGPVPVHDDPAALTGSLYGTYRVDRNIQAFFGVSQGFRAPNVDDTTVLGSFAGGFEVPNPLLVPERSRNYEVGLKAHGRGVAGTVSYFVSDYRRLIERVPGQFHGLGFLDGNGNGLRDRGEDRVFTRQNIGEARVWGVGLEGQWRPSERWTAYGNVAWTTGDNTITGDPLTRIPPAKGLAGARWRPRRRVWVEGYSLLAWRQDRLSPADHADRRIRPGGTPGFATWNVRGGVELGREGTLTVGLENLSNKVYRWHGSGIDAPGRNLVLGFGHTFR